MSLDDFISTPTRAFGFLWPSNFYGAVKAVAAQPYSVKRCRSKVILNYSSPRGYPLPFAWAYSGLDFASPNYFKERNNKIFIKIKQ